MSVAMAFPESQKGKRNDLTSVKITEVTGINSGSISHARKVLRYLPHRAQLVMHGELPLSEAYKEAQQAETIANNEQQQREAAQREGYTRTGKKVMR